MTTSANAVFCFECAGDDQHDNGCPVTRTSPSFTPGPWMLVRKPGEVWGVGNRDDPSDLAEVRGSLDGTSEGNARLIAKAPDLYRLLESMLSADALSDPASDESLAIQREARLLLDDVAGVIR